MLYLAYGCRIEPAVESHMRHCDASGDSSYVWPVDPEVEAFADRLASDMAHSDADCDMDGIMSPQESISGMLRVIAARTRQDSGTFWKWDGQVRRVSLQLGQGLN